MARDPNEFKAQPPAGNAPDVSNTLETPYVRYIAGITCESTSAQTGTNVTVKVDGKPMSPYVRDPDGQSPTQAIFALVTAPLHEHGITTGDQATHTGGDTNEILFTANGSPEEVRKLLSPVLAAAEAQRCGTSRGQG